MSILKFTQNILGKYENDHGLVDVPIQVDKLKPIFEIAGYADEIQFKEIDFESKLVLAQIKTYKIAVAPYANHDDLAIIYFTKNNNLCWRRFVLCKEMYHCILDKERKNRITNTDDVFKLGEFLSGGVVESIPGGKFLPFETEQLAELLAVETLMPYVLRKHHFDAIDSGEISHHEIALRYRVPRKYAQIAMSEYYRTGIYASWNDPYLDRNLVD